MVDVLVAYASKMGSTAEIAEVIGAELRTARLVVEVCPVTEVDSLAPYPEVVLGSAIYLRRWRPEAVRFLRRFTAQLLERRVWLFHSGPCGERDRHQPQPAPAQVRRLCRRIGADEPVTFGGLLDPSRARGVLARWMARGELAGDFRSWDEIRGWARSVGSQITPRDEEPPGRPSPDHRWRPPARRPRPPSDPHDPPAPLQERTDRTGHRVVGRAVVARVAAGTCRSGRSAGPW